MSTEHGLELIKAVEDCLREGGCSGVTGASAFFTGWRSEGILRDGELRVILTVYMRNDGRNEIDILTDKKTLTMPQARKMAAMISRAIKIGEEVNKALASLGESMDERDGGSPEPVRISDIGHRGCQP